MFLRVTFTCLETIDVFNSNVLEVDVAVIIVSNWRER